MHLFRSRRESIRLDKQIQDVRERGEQTALELERVKRRQQNIEARLSFLQQELQVQQRNASA